MEIDDYLSGRQKSRQRRKKYFFLGAALVILYILLFSASWVVLRSPVFRVQNVVIRGNDTVPSGDIMALLQSSALRDHDFWKALLGFRNMLIWPYSVAPDDLRMIPQLAALTLSKDYFSHTITATATERKPFGIWCLRPEAEEQCYWFDNEGTAFEKTFDTQGSLMFAVHDYSQGKVGLNGKVLPAPFVDNFISILTVIRESGIDTKEIALKNIDLQEMDITTYNGPALYFSLRFPSDNDLPVLQSLMAKPSFGKLQYVDFRVENRAYYK